MAYVFDFQNTLIEITSPQTEVIIQDLIDEIRTVESSEQGIAYPKIANASGKESLASGVNVGITVELQNGWQLHFWTGSYTATIKDGNLVGGPAGDPIAYTAGVQIVLIQSASATIVSTGGSALTQEEHDELFAVADTVWDEVLTGATHNVPASAGRRLRQLGDVIPGIVNDVSATNERFISDLTAVVSGFYNDQYIRFTTGNLEGQVRVVSDYEGSNGVFVVNEPWSHVPQNTDEFDLLPVHVHSSDQIIDAMWDVQLDEHSLAGSTGQALADVLAGVEDSLGISGENTKWTGMAFDANDNLISAVITQYTDDTLTVERKKWQLTATYDLNSRLTAYQLKEY
jgi:hypothetical protein